MPHFWETFHFGTVDFLALPMDRVRALAASPVEPARQADATRDPEIPPFAASQ